MNTLTTVIAVPQINNLRISRIASDLDELSAYVLVQVRSAAGIVYRVVSLTVRNGTSDGIRATPSPKGFLDRIDVFSVLTPTGFTDILAANVGATLAIRLRSVESALITLGLLPPGVVS